MNRNEMMWCRGFWKAITLGTAFLLLLCSASAFADNMKYPDWESQWRNPNAGIKGNAWDPTRKMGVAQEAPLTPEYEAIFKASINDQHKGGQGNSLGASCILTGMPKLMSLAQPIEIFIKPNVTYIVPTHDPIRRIYTDGRAWPKDALPTFTGYSIGKWVDTDGDGQYDELDVETRDFKGPRVFESDGLPLAKDNQTIVKEQIYLNHYNKNLLHDKVTTIDHALTQPWTVLKTYVRDQHPVWIEWNCHASNNHVRVGKETYFLSADGKLMPTRKDQPPPDLSNFK